MSVSSQTPVSFLSFSDPRSAATFFARLPMADPEDAGKKLIQILDNLLAAPPGAGDLFSLLEQARAPMSFVGDETAKAYVNKPLVLGENDEAAFQRMVAIWRKVVRAYELCAELDDSASSQSQDMLRVATILHRCIYYTGMIIMEHYRARRELPAGIWLQLHGFYETAEEWQVATTPLTDILEHGDQTTHCAATYVAALLVDLANPFSQSTADLQLIRRWAGMWAPIVPISPVSDPDRLPSYVVDLMKDEGLRPTKAGEDFNTEMRRLDVAKLGAAMDEMLSQLRQRVSPARLGLGQETSSHVIGILEQLLRPWMLAPAARRFHRFQSSGEAQVCIGFPAMHFAITGQEFSLPNSANIYSRTDYDNLFSFGQLADQVQTLTPRPRCDYPVDEWDVVNHSVLGFRIARTAVGQKLALGQLLALCPQDGERFLLAKVCWMMQEHEGGLLAGIAVLPGMPQGIAVRLADTRSGGIEHFERAFMLPAIPAVDEAGSLVLPVGMYHASRDLEIRDAKGNWRVRMKHRLQIGVDFERVSYSVA